MKILYIPYKNKANYLHTNTKKLISTLKNHVYLYLKI